MDENELENAVAEAVERIVSPPDFAAARNSLSEALQPLPVTHSKPVHGGGELGRTKPLDQLDTAVKRLSAVEEAVAALGQRLVGSALDARRVPKPYDKAPAVSARISSNADEIVMYCDRIMTTIKRVDEILG